LLRQRYELKRIKQKAGWEKKKESINRRRKQARQGRQGWGSRQRLRQCTLEQRELILRKLQLQKVLLDPQEFDKLQRGFSPCFPFSPLWSGRELVLRMQWQGCFFFSNFPYKQKLSKSNEKQRPSQEINRIFQRFAPSPPRIVSKNPSTKNP